MSDLRTQVRNLFEHVDSNQPPMTVDDIKRGQLVHRISSPSPQPPLRRAWAVGLASALVVLAVGLLAVWLSQGPEETPVVTQPITPPSITAPPTTTALTTSPPMSAPPTSVPPTSAPPTTRGEARNQAPLTFESIVIAGLGSPNAVVSDGSTVFALGSGGLFSSRDGVDWHEIVVESPLLPAALQGGPVAAWDQVILTVSTSPEGVTAYTIDTASRSVSATDLPFRASEGSGDLAFGPRGAVLFTTDTSPGSDQRGAAWYSPDGLEWIDISDRGPFDAGWVRLVAVERGFIAVASTSDGLPTPSEEGYWVGDGLEWDQMVWDRDPRTGWALFPWQGSAIAYQSHAFANPSLADNPTWRLDFNSGSAQPFPTAGLDSLGPDLVSGVGPAVASGGLGIVSITGQNEVGYYEYSPDGSNWARGRLPGGLFADWATATWPPVAVNEVAVVFLTGGTAGDPGLAVATGP